jgi:hypothetical protein
MTTKNTSHTEVALLLSYLGVAIFQILWHWFLSSRQSLAQTLLRIYLYHNPQTGREVEGYLDVMLPAVLFGFLAGWLGSQWSIRKLSLPVVCGAIGVIALMPLYTVFFDKALVWWWPKTTGELLPSLVLGTIKALIIVGIFAYAGRIFATYFHGLSKP